MTEFYNVLRKICQLRKKLGECWLLFGRGGNENKLTLTLRMVSILSGCLAACLVGCANSVFSPTMFKTFRISGKAPYRDTVALSFAIVICSSGSGSVKAASAILVRASEYRQN